MADKIVTITLEHPEVEGGSVRYSTADGYEIVLFVGKPEANGKYFFHRMTASKGPLIRPIAEFMVKSAHEEIMGALLEDTVSKMKELVGDQILGVPPTNKTTIN